MLLSCGHHTLDLSRPVVMGVLNVTPDSFSDGGRFLRTADAVRQAVSDELYERPEVWQLIGFEGPSAPASGRLSRRWQTRERTAHRP